VNADDDLLAERLRAVAARADGVPDLVDRGARAALSTRRLDAELAELVLDSAATTGAVRGDDRPRLLTFRATGVTVELQVQEAAGGLTLRGLVAGAAGEVAVETPAGRRTAGIDGDGWFTVDGLPRGSARLWLVTASGAAVTTSWTLL
jgi:hypothetical protein